MKKGEIYESKEFGFVLEVIEESKDFVKKEPFTSYPPFGSDLVGQELMLRN